MNEEEADDERVRGYDRSLLWWKRKMRTKKELIEYINVVMQSIFVMNN